MAIDISQFMDAFVEESIEGLDVIESTLVGADTKALDNDTISVIFRAAHSIKGGAGTFGLNEISQFTHVAETLLDQIRSGARIFEQSYVELLLESVDCLREMFGCVQNKKPIEVPRSSKIVADFERVLASNTVSLAENAEITKDKNNIVGWNISFKPDIALFKTGNDPLRLFKQLKSLGVVTVSADDAALPDFDLLDPLACYLTWTIKVVSDNGIPLSELKEIFEWIEDECDIQYEPLVNISLVSSVADVVMTKAAKPVEHVDDKKEAKSGMESSSIRVAIEKIDQLVNLVGELVITQSMLGEVGENFDLSKLSKLREGLAQLEFNTRELQESVMRIRMVPISFIFSRFPRMVHDLGKKLGKQVELKLLGEGTELDKTVMEKLTDPLVHIVRNSLDHGLEMPDVRQDNNKEATGLLTLNSYHQSGHIVIEVSDDGKGIDTMRLRAKAIKNGLITEEDALTHQELVDLVFHPGLSTAEAVTDLSGRGVGMDVVKKNIQGIGGSVEVNSTTGAGTMIRIRLPLTLAILEGQLICLANEIFIIPLVNIIESLQLNASALNKVVGNWDVMQLREEYVPIIELAEVFRLNGARLQSKNKLIVIVENEGKKFGLVVDELLAQQQVVIKSLEANYQQVSGISGATILGDGTVSLILDVPSILKMADLKMLEKENSNFAGKETEINTPQAA